MEKSRIIEDCPVIKTDSVGIKKNTVSAVNQMINSSDLSFLGNEKAKTRILIVGNSITRHGPKPDIGWVGDWGMAASAPEKDYVHRLYAKLIENKQDVFIRIRQCAFWERNFLRDDILSNYDEEKAFHADVVVFRLGENVTEEDKPYFKDALRAFISHICPKKGKTVYTTCFWKNDIIDQAIEEVAKERGEICLDGFLAKDKTNMALGQFEHGGVAVHPSDKGMEEIAELIFGTLGQKNLI